MTTDTPRTDAAEMPIDRIDTIASRPACVVHADFAQELERELAASQAEVAFWKIKAYEAEQSEGKHEAELSMWRDGGIMHSAHSNEIDELKAEVDRLRSLLKRAVEIAEDSVGLADLDYENDKFGKVSELKQELAALKEQIK